MAKAKKESRTKEQQREAILQTVIGSVEKQFGSGAIYRLGEDGSGPKRSKLEVFSSGVLKLDKAIGIGGYPRGRMIECFGPESSGKTTLALHAIASVQRQGGICAFIDAEHALDVMYAEKLGVSLKDLLISQPDTGEEALEIVETMARSGVVDLIIVDSVAALVPKAEIEGDMGDSHVGLQARLMSQACRKLSGIVSKTGAILFWINQIRMKIGVRFGSPETTTGGNALKFYSSIRMDIRRIGAVKKGEEVIGNNTRVKIIKNKVAPPFKQFEGEVIYNKGFDPVREILDLAVDLDIIDKSGSWFTYENTSIGQGREKACAFLEENPVAFEDVQKKVRAAYIPDDVLAMPTPPPPSAAKVEEKKDPDSNKSIVPVLPS